VSTKLERFAVRVLTNRLWFVSVDGASVLSLAEYARLSPEEADRYIAEPFRHLDSANLYASCVRDMRRLWAMT
jgi:hypothetical protein